MKELFTPGQEVMCLKDSWHVLNLNPDYPNVQLPRKNEIYVVKESLPCEQLHKVFITLEGIPPELVFNQRSFAPVMPTLLLANELTSIFQSTII